MKKFINYSLLMFLISLVVFACSKEDEFVNPNFSPLNKTGTDQAVQEGFIDVNGYDVYCLKHESGNIWSVEIEGPGNIQGAGLSHLNLELLDCYGDPLDLSECEVEDASIEVDGVTYVMPTDFVIEYTDNSCGTRYENIIKFDIKNDDLGDLLKENTATFTFELSCDEPLSGANVVIKTGNGCNAPALIGTCEDYCVAQACAYSQGYWFSSKVSAGWGSVTVGSLTLTEAYLRDLFRQSGNTVQQKAYFQAAALILSGTDISELPADVQAAYNYITGYFNANNTALLTSTLLKSQSQILQMHSGKIGDWISENGCED